MKTISFDLKKWSVAVSKEVIKKAVYNPLNAKVNYLKKKIPDAFFNSNKSIWHKYTRFGGKILKNLATTVVLNTKISGGVEKKNSWC